jgi:hypothetical protein
LPDVLICCDLDHHPDHIATSLFFEEVMGIILKGNPGYRPIVLKRYAYEGAWFGICDYWKYQPTFLSGKKHRFDALGYTLDTPSYKMEDLISINTSLHILTRRLEDSQLYIAAKKYKSQPLYLKMNRVLNSNSIMWLRRTDNLAMKADIEVSSGQYEMLNDFKLLDCIDVNEGRAESFYDFGWIPEKNDKRKSVVFHFKSKVDIQSICLYEVLSPENHIKSCLITINDIHEYCIGELSNRAGKNEVVFSDIIENVKKVEIQIMDYIGKAPGLAGVEIFEKIDEASTQKVLSILGCEEACVQMKPRIIVNFLRSLVYNLRYLFRFKLYFGFRKVKKIIFKGTST